MLFDAIANNESEFVKTLLFEGANIFEVNGLQESTFFVAAKFNNEETVEVLLNWVKMNSKIAEKDKRYYELLGHVTRGTIMEEVYDLVNHEYYDKNGESIFVFAILMNRKAYVEAFLKYNPKYLQKIDIRGRCVLHWVSQSRHVEMLTFFLNKCASVMVNQKDYDGHAPLNLAAHDEAAHDLDVRCSKVLQLLKFGKFGISDPNLLNDGQLLLCICHHGGVCVVFKYLLTLKIAGLKFSPKVSEVLASDFNEEHLSNLKQKFEELKSIVVNIFPKKTLHDLFLMNRYQLVCYANNKILKDILLTPNLNSNEYFDVLKFLFLKLQYRHYLLQESVQKLNNQWGTVVPIGCSLKIFSHFSNKELIVYNLYS